MSREQVLETGFKAVRRARTLCADVEFSAEDAIRTEPEFLIQALSTMIEAGATTVNVPDTVGYTTPEEEYSSPGRIRLWSVASVCRIGSLGVAHRRCRCSMERKAPTATGRAVPIECFSAKTHYVV